MSKPLRPFNENRPSLDAAFDSGEDSSDERLVRHAPVDERGARGITEDTARNASDDLMSEAEYMALVRSEFEQTALPTPPAIPGWHLCWCTTTSNYDSISRRRRMGYQPVTIAELPGFDPSNGQSLVHFEGFVTCNEMVLCKILEHRYLQMMKYFHHQVPQENAQSTLDRIRERGLDVEQDKSGRDLGKNLGSGYLEMEKTAKRVDREPRFAN
jgi:hypothetical protein